MVYKIIAVNVGGWPMEIIVRITKKRVYKRQVKIYAINRKKYLEYLKTHPCGDCGESDIRLLDFDHVFGDKFERVARLLHSYSWEAVEQEIAKCEVRCVNCHRRRSAMHDQYSRYLISTICDRSLAPQTEAGVLELADKFSVLGLKSNSQEALRRNIIYVRIFSYLCSHPCVDCGLSDVVVLEFDHIKDVKYKDISTMVAHGYGWKRIYSEILKCDVRCANCHRLKTIAKRAHILIGKETFS